MRRIVLVVLASTALAGCSQPDVSTYDSPAAIVDALEDAGHQVTEVDQTPPPNFITEIGGEAWDLHIDQVEAGINMFPDEESLDSWVELSKSFGGVAVVGDTWAVSLDSDPENLAASESLADDLAETLDGEVEK